VKAHLALSLVLAALAIGGGCRMCQQCYDYTAPAYDDQGDQQLGFCERRGSILGGRGPGMVPPMANIQDPQPTLAPAPAPAPSQQPPAPTI
jgi:hypothetical protein